MNRKGYSDEILDKNKARVVGQGRKGLGVINWPRTWLNCVCMYPCVLWKVELESNKTEYLAEEISK